MFLYKASVASDCEFNMSDVDSTFISTSTISEVHVEQVHIKAYNNIMLLTCILKGSLTIITEVFSRRA